MTDSVSSYFAPAERESSEQVSADLENITHNPVIDSILTSVGGLLAVLNSSRQIITANSTLLESLGIPDIRCILGKRLGEALDCPHADLMDGGCGTSKYCLTCGAVIAMVSSLDTGKISEEKCYIEKKDNGQMVDLSFSVRACPLKIDDKDFLLLFLRDISAEERWQAMERSFFHDINNVISSVMGSSEMLKLKNNVDEKSHEAYLLNKVIKRLVEEVSVHRLLCDNKGYEDLTRRDEYRVSEVCNSLESLFETHPGSKGKTLQLVREGDDKPLFTNSTLLLRVLTNMMTNAFEASEKGDTVRLTAAEKEEGILFSVWNRQHIPEKVALRVFQKNFSTKSENGRGLGTFGMKLFGEKILGGKVSFTTDLQKGTTFSIFLPVK
ncbi:MAG: sensor histidine kinase [Spirochaetales bacterium]|nr:sensor histidine kinase [Spirochaetales bacterium]